MKLLYKLTPLAIVIVALWRIVTRQPVRYEMGRCNADAKLTKKG